MNASNIVKIALYILTALDALILIAVVLMQEGQSGGLAGMVGGESEFGEFGTRSKASRLKLYTKVTAGLLMAMSIGLVVIEKFWV